MRLLKVTLTNCYGIGTLTHTFDFDVHPGSGHDNLEHSQTNLVYARNGIMKTSLAKTLKDYSQEALPNDALHGRKPSIEIRADGVDLPPESVCVLQSNDEYFESSEMATLLSNKQDQKRYEEIMLEIDSATTDLFEKTAKSMKIRGGAKNTLAMFDSNFKNANFNRLQLIKSMKPEVENARPELIGMDYKLLENPKIIAFLEKSSTQLMIKDYINTYEQLLSESTYFKEGLYDYSHAFKVQKSLEDNNFMKNEVGNKVIVVAKDKSEKIITTNAELKQAYEEDMSRIFKSLEEQVAYEKFDKEIGINPDLRSLKTWSSSHKELVPYLKNSQHTRRLTWQTHFAANMETYDNLLETYDKHQDELDGLIKRSKAYESEWKHVVSSFKESFRPKFDIQVRNQQDVVLKSEKPELVFIYTDDRGGIPKEIPVKILSDHVFSTGERRALYILCMMFEIRVRILTGLETLLILDDIADSFDYKNKYAIIEYLHDVSIDTSNNVYMIVLTHNYDFFRSLRMRCQMRFNTSPKVFTVKRNRGVITLSGNVHSNEFKLLKQESSTNLRAFFALIPLARNLIEYRDGHADPEFKLLTSVLHDKVNSRSISVDQTIAVVNSNIHGANLTQHASSNSIQKAVIAEADLILTENQDDSLEDKLTLAIAIRIKAERHMRSIFVNDGKTIDDASGNQTGTWYGRTLQDYPIHNSIKTLKQVSIATPETIHINSFMFEPIVDMAIDELQVLYQEVSNL